MRTLDKADILINTESVSTDIFVTSIPLPHFSLISYDLVHLVCTPGLGPFAAKLSMSGSSSSLTAPPP